MNKRFTLIELMMVVGVVALLTAMAMPAVAASQLKAKRTEISVLGDGITTAATAHVAVHGPVYSAVWNPDATPSKRARAWLDTGVFNQIGFRPDGDVRGSYQVGDLITYIPGMGCPSFTMTCGPWGLDQVCVSAIMDADGDGNYACGSVRIDESNGTSAFEMKTPSDWY